jgi:beta-glucanase (GH16 family)
MNRFLFYVLITLCFSNVPSAIAQYGYNPCGQQLSTCTYNSTGVSGPITCPTEPWKLVFHDEFSGGAVVVSKWYTFFPKWPEHTDAWQFGRTHSTEGSDQIFLDNNLVVNNGSLKIVAKREQATWMGATKPFTSGVIHSKPSFLYGKIEMRCRMPVGNGFWPAFWMYNGDELDIFEGAGNIIDKLWQTLHMSCSPGVNIGEENCGTERLITNYIPGYNISQWHTYSAEWSKDEVKWLIDGVSVRRVGRLSNPRTTGQQTDYFYCGDALPVGNYQNNLLIPNQNISVIANLGIARRINSTAVAGFGGNASGVPDATTPFPSTMEIDYIRVWQRTPQGGLTDLCAQGTVNGNDVICHTTQNYTYQYTGPNGAVLNWVLSNNLTLVSSTANSITVKANSISPNSGYIQANFGAGVPCASSAKKDIWVGGVAPLSFVTRQPFCQEADVNITEISNNSSSCIYNWTTQVNSDPVVSFVSGKFISVSGVYGQNNTIRYSLNVTNNCGSLSSGQKITSTITCPTTGGGPRQWRVAITPNPAQDIFQIEVINKSEMKIKTKKNSYL